MSPGTERTCTPLPSEFCARLVEEAPYGIFVVQDGRIVHGNRWVREFGGPAPGRPDRPDDLFALVYPDDREPLLRQIKLRLAGQEAAPSVSVRLVKRSGDERLVEITTAAIVHCDRPAVRVILTDVTARADAERNLQEYASRLDASNRFRRLFGDILSHDLMNPVWIAENYLRLVMDGGVPEAKRAFFEGMRNSLAKARGILTDARTYLRIQDQIALVGERVDLGALVEEVVETLRPSWEERQQQISVNLAPGAAVNATPQFREIVWHLLSNAIKFGPQESAIAVVVGGGRRVRLEVRDHGPGVPPEDRERIFQRFENRDKGPITGVGLGLAIVRRLAEQHDGRVWAEDNPEGGAVFIAEFPAAD